MNQLDEVLFFDVETTGLPTKGQTYEKDFMDFPHIVQIAWSLGGVDKESIITPDGWEIPEDAAKIHGITTEIARKSGSPLEVILMEFFKDVEKATFICGHNIYFDTSTIKANVLRTLGNQYYDKVVEKALHKSKRIDTMMKTIKFVGAKKENGGSKTPTLMELYQKVFPGETFDAHDALEDVLAVKRILPELVKEGIIELKLKEYPEENVSKFEKAISETAEKTTSIKVKEFVNLGKSFGLSGKYASDLLNQENDI